MSALKLPNQLVAVVEAGGERVAGLSSDMRLLQETAHAPTRRNTLFNHEDGRRKTRVVVECKFISKHRERTSRLLLQFSWPLSFC